MKNNHDLRERITCFSDDLYEGEDILRNFLFDNCNIIRFTNVPHIKIGLAQFKKAGGNRDKTFIATVDKLSPFFLKTLTNNMRFENIEQGKKKKFTHYFYRLSQEIKYHLNKETLLFDSYNNSSCFYGFEDPTFYIDDIMAGCIISHEDELVLFLTEKEKKFLQDKGFTFETKDTVIVNGKYTVMTRKNKSDEKI